MVNNVGQQKNFIWSIIDGQQKNFIWSIIVGQQKNQCNNRTLISIFESECETEIKWQNKMI